MRDRQGFNRSSTATSSHCDNGPESENHPERDCSNKNRRAIFLETVVDGFEIEIGVLELRLAPGQEGLKALDICRLRKSLGVFADLSAAAGQQSVLSSFLPKLRVLVVGAHVAHR